MSNPSFIRGLQEGEGIKEGEKINLINPVKERGKNEQDVGMKRQLEKYLVLKSTLAFHLRLHCQVSSVLHSSSHLSALVPLHPSGFPVLLCFTPSGFPVLLCFTPSICQGLPWCSLLFSLFLLSHSLPLLPWTLPSVVLELESLSFSPFSCTVPPSSIPSS